MADLVVTSAHWSEAGAKATNEDSCGVRIPDHALRVAKGIAAVIADGMSGSEGGMEASYACVESFLADYFSTPESWSVKLSGEKVLTALNRWLHGEGHQRYGSPQGMVATLSALVLKSTTAHLFHLGDTRIYRIRGTAIECLTRDHRVRVSSDTHCLSRAVGIELNIQIDYRAAAVEKGDLFLLTTDGVHDVLDEDRMVRILHQHPGDLEVACKEMVAEALAKGSADNLTSLVVRIDQLPPQDKHAFYQQLTALPFPPPLRPGLILDGYRILRELHASKRSELYLAVDEETRTQLVLKVPSENYEDDPAYIDLFLHESWIGRRLDSPHVAKVLDLKRPRTFLYAVMEYIEGQTLRQWMSDHPLPALQEVRNVIEQLAVGLRAFHRKEMIHQDLKPENIMIDMHGTVKIIDFGSTKVAGIEEIATPIERPYLLGTANYTAIEYLQGFAGSNRSDIFSLGVIAYELLTGYLPYGADVTPASLNTLTYTPAYRYNPAVPAWMDGALEKAVHPNPVKRYAALSELIYDLSHPNPNFIKEKPLPLIDRHPVDFWRVLAIIFLVTNLILMYFLAQ